MLSVYSLMVKANILGLNFLLDFPVFFYHMGFLLFWFLLSGCFSTRISNKVIEDHLSGDTCQYWNTNTGYSIQFCTKRVMRYYSIQDDGTKNFNLSSDYQFDNFEWYLKHPYIMIEGDSIYRMLYLSNDSLIVYDVKHNWSEDSICFVREPR